MSSPFPTVLLWGDALTQIHNDEYRVLMGVKHPAGLRQATQACWPEVWAINEPIYTRVRAGESIAFEDALYPITRSGVLEDAWFTLGYSPLRSAVADAAGILVTVLETTARVHARRLEDERVPLVSELDAAPSRVLDEVFRARPEQRGRR